MSAPSPPSATQRAASPVLQLQGITKSFGGTRALVSGELELFPGTVTALIGENGAGKSTLEKYSPVCTSRMTDASSSMASP